MNELVNNDNIESMIYKVRGVAVKRNIDRFPDDFYFQLTKEECLRFQIGTLNSKGNMRGQHFKYLPYAFTEQGVAMLATVIKTDVAEVK